MFLICAFSLILFLSAFIIMGLSVSFWFCISSALFHADVALGGNMTGKQDGYSSIISGQFFWHHIPRDSADVMLINRTCIISNKRPLAQCRLCRSWTLSALASHISMPVHLSEWEVLLMHLASLFWTKIHFLDWKLVWMLFRSFRGSEMRVVLLH